MAETVNTQIRLPEELHKFLKEEAARLKIPMNALMIMLMHYGMKAHISEVTMIMRQRE